MLAQPWTVACRRVCDVGFSVSVVESDQGRSGGRLRRRWTRKAKGSARSDCIVMHLWPAGLARDESAPAVNTRPKNNPEWVGDRERSRGRVGESPHLGWAAYLIRSGLPTSKSLSCSATCDLSGRCSPNALRGREPARGAASSISRLWASRRFRTSRCFEDVCSMSRAGNKTRPHHTQARGVSMEFWGLAPKSGPHSRAGPAHGSHR